MLWELEILRELRELEGLRLDLSLLRGRRSLVVESFLLDGRRKSLLAGSLLFPFLHCDEDLVVTIDAVDRDVEDTRCRCDNRLGLLLLLLGILILGQILRLLLNLLLGSLLLLLLLRILGVLHILNVFSILHILNVLLVLLLLGCYRHAILSIIAISDGFIVIIR